MDGQASVMGSLRARGNAKAEAARDFLAAAPRRPGAGAAGGCQVGVDMSSVVVFVFICLISIWHWGFGRHLAPLATEGPWGVFTGDELPSARAGSTGRGGFRLQLTKTYTIRF